MPTPEIPAELLEETPESRALCERIAEESEGVCLLGFSRGKDSIAAWLHLRRHFKRIIPFCAGLDLPFVERSLKYYEEFFQTPILRFVAGDLPTAINGMVYQPPECEGDIDILDASPYSMTDIVRRLRSDLDLPRVWCAWGINASDSLDRRVYVMQYKGRLPRRKSFYPNFDWKRDRIMAWIRAAGVKLPDDYIISNRTISGIPIFREVAMMKEKLPEDYKALKEIFPLADALLARQEFRIRRFERAGKDWFGAKARKAAKAAGA